MRPVLLQTNISKAEQARSGAPKGARAIHSSRVAAVKVQALAKHTRLCDHSEYQHLSNLLRKPGQDRLRDLSNTRAVKSAGSLSTSTSSSTSAGSSSGGGLLSDDKTSSRPLQNHHRALVLDRGYRPINVVPWSRAVMLDVSDKCAVLDYYPPPACAISGQGEHPLPAVMVVHSDINLHDTVTKVACTRRNVLVRDKFQCQYCGVSRDLTLDHVVPASRGGKDTWDNLVTACASCNQKKADKTLSQLGWTLRIPPREPTPWELGVVVGLSHSDIENPPPAWEPYIEPYRERQRRIERRLTSTGTPVPQMAHA